MKLGNKYMCVYIYMKIPLEKEMATYSSIIASEIPWTEKPGGAVVHGVSKSQT